MYIPDRATPGYCESHFPCLMPNDRACPANTGREPGAHVQGGGKRRERRPLKNKTEIKKARRGPVPGHAT
ncbi:hypothetical protein chiPu_0027623 [Chiloscyllium punctatum]|uniref:Uncharacterized protein n=1 Tax=Chiloscyllium punctatum TaxID=137246 RepID=A0A401TKZ8_CHIPU|nr:hypothetical protein [Chiloscyllium punctatum]